MEQDLTGSGQGEPKARVEGFLTARSLRRMTDMGGGVHLGVEGLPEN